MPAPPFAAGDIVAVRGRHWNIEEAVSYGACTLLRLSGLHGPAAGSDCKLLHPFDRPVRQKVHRRVRMVTPSRWMQALQSQLADCRSFSQLRSAAPASIDILAFQLEPVLAVVQGLASRVLIADEVGLGKTIQAGLILSELRQRGWCDRALVLTPAGLREQWSDELTRRFGIRAAIVDAPALLDSIAACPAGVNPWSIEAVSIASIDFIKQPEVLRALTSLMWDLLVVDEAHQVATAQQRAAAVERLARRARHVVLLTATPHDGDAAAYQSLCAVGSLAADDPLAIFHRTRADVGLNRARRVHLLSIRLSGEEMEMHQLLRQYAARVWRIGQRRADPSLQLIATILTKRALSSASALAISVRRRLNALDAATDPHTESLQSALPFEADDDQADAEPLLGTPAFDRITDEQDALRGILRAAEKAVLDERKIAALQRLLRRVAEPSIVFTEYRDTLDTLEAAVSSNRRPALLHGGLNRHERRDAVEAFIASRADVLLATDAGSEGLNLHKNCRFVVNLELPWNPVRLEQRIGRVDRLGQTRTVHATHLVAATTAETAVLARLMQRVEKIRTEADIALEIFHDDRSESRSGRSS